MYVNVRIVGFDEIVLYMVIVICEGYDEMRVVLKFEEEEGILLYEMV